MLNVGREGGFMDMIPSVRTLTAELSTFKSRSEPSARSIPYCPCARVYESDTVCFIC